MAKKRASKLPRWAMILWWVFGVVVGLGIILFAALQIWLSTWKTYNIRGVIVKAPSTWDVRDTSKDSNGGGLIVGYQSVLKIGDKSTDVTKGPDDLQNYQGNVIIYVLKNSSTGEYYKEIETEGITSIKNSYYKLLGNLVSSYVIFPSK